MTDPIRRTSLLDRTSFTEASALSPIQSQVDGLVSHAVEEAANPRTLTAIVAGGAAYRFGRMGIMALGANATGTAATVVRGLSVVGGLGTEVTAFEFTNRSLQTLSPVTAHRSPNLWSWSGQGGWAQGLTTSAITFGMLKSAGFAAREQNVILQHAFQSTAMVAGHNTAGVLGIAPRPEGSLAEQFLHAEATNIQLGAGMSLVHSMAPGMAGMERAWDLSLRSRVGAGFPRPGAETAPLRPNFAMAGGRGPSPVRESFEIPNVMLSEAQGPGGGGGSKALATRPADWPANLSEAWLQVRGSRLYTGRDVRNTQELAQVIVGNENSGLLKALGPQAVHSIFGYGSNRFFRDGRPEDIRTYDVDKKPDLIIIGNMREMVDNLARHWGLTEAQRLELQDHGTFELDLKSHREGFIYHNTDILIPGRGPSSFKISILDAQAFFAVRNGRTVLEYSQIRLKDATSRSLIWSRSEAEKAQSLTHMESIRDEMMEQGYNRPGGLIRTIFGHTPLPRISDIRAVMEARRAGRPTQWLDRLILRPLSRLLGFYKYSATGEELGRSFFTLSFRLEAYRFWENLWGPMDKGKKLFNERRDEAREVLVPAFQRFAQRHSKTMRLKLYGKTITPEQITAENLYDVFFIDRGLRQGVFGRMIRYYRGILPYFALNRRGYHSYKKHGLPSNLLSQAYYVQSPQEYAGRKARGIIEKAGAFGKFLNWALSGDRAKRWRPTRQIALDSKFSPVYYSQIAPYINDLFAGGRSEKERKNFPQELRLNDGEYRALTGWIVDNPQLTTLKNVELLRSLNALRTSSDLYAQSGATKLFRWIEGRPRTEPEVADYIRSLNLPATITKSPMPTVPAQPAPEVPTEISQIVELNLPYINFLVAGDRPRIYQFLRESIALSIGDDPGRVAQLFDYIDRTEAGEMTPLRGWVEVHRPHLSPELASQPIPAPRAITLERPVLPPSAAALSPEERRHLADAVTVSPTGLGESLDPSDPKKK